MIWPICFTMTYRARYLIHIRAPLMAAHLMVRKLWVFAPVERMEVLVSVRGCMLTGCPTSQLLILKVHFVHVEGVKTSALVEFIYPYNTFN